jgi:hypothetical protein
MPSHPPPVAADTATADTRSRATIAWPFAAQSEARAQSQSPRQLRTPSNSLGASIELSRRRDRRFRKRYSPTLPPIPVPLRLVFAPHCAPRPKWSRRTHPPVGISEPDAAQPVRRSPCAPTVLRLWWSMSCVSPLCRCHMSHPPLPHGQFSGCGCMFSGESESSVKYIGTSRCGSVINHRATRLPLIISGVRRRNRHPLVNRAK